MSGNQVQVPVIQTSVDSLTQIQQNTNKVLRNINNQVVTLQNTVNTIQAIGDVLFSPLTISQFQAAHSTDWIIANGQSAVGTAYEALTMNQTVPNITLSGAIAFIKVN